MRFRRHAKQEVDISINIIPLVDVLFVLLLFFMVATTFTKESHLKVELAKASAKAVEKDKDSYEIIIDRAGRYQVNGVWLPGQASALKQALMALVKNNSQSLLVTADANTPHQAVVTAMDVAGQLGLINLKITTQQNTTP